MAGELGKQGREGAWMSPPADKEPDALQEPEAQVTWGVRAEERWPKPPREVSWSAPAAPQTTFRLVYWVLEALEDFIRQGHVLISVSLPAQWEEWGREAWEGAGRAPAVMRRWYEVRDDVCENEKIRLGTGELRTSLSGHKLGLVCAPTLFQERLLKKLFTTLVRDGETDFIQDPPAQYRGPEIGFRTGKRDWTQLTAAWAAGNL